MQKNVATLIIVLLIIETIALGWLVYDRYMQQKNQDKLQSELVVVKDEKTKVEEDLTAMMQQYEDLKTDNEEVNAQLEMEQKKIERIMTQLKKTKANDRYKIKQLEAEAETLRSIMKGYIRQIDSLNTMNQELTVENIQVKKQYKAEIEEKEVLQTEKDSLTSQVKKAAVLKVYNLNPMALNRWGRDTKRAGWVKDIKVCFDIAENDLAYAGKRYFYLRIAAPDGVILIDDDSGLFPYQGNNIAFSGRREFNYTGESAQLCLFWNAGEDKLLEGTYTVDIYADGNKIGKETLFLK
ncbi:MAG: hypothetical protein U9N85_10095 [Bacteroidota bacterium]|nr:hypothetical protein [Bacteroidota bacterium]